jgi:hypothetical protein
LTQPEQDSTTRVGGRARVSDKKGPGDHVDELKQLVIGYARQETVDPLKSLGRYLGFGIAGSVLVGVGVSMSLLGILRLLQSLDVFADDGPAPGAMSLIPYAVTLLVGAIVIGLSARAMMSAPPKRRGGGGR